MPDISNMADMIDVRDIIERIEGLRESAEPAMPDDIEVFYHDGERTSEDDCWADSDGNPLPAGWYYWTCLPGCMPEGDPIGPFETEELAEEDAVESHGEIYLDDDDKAELTMLETLMSDLAGNGGDEQWEGTWYPVTLIRDSYFITAMQELCEDIGDFPNGIPSYYVIDWKATARNLQVDYSSVEFDGVTYWCR